MKKAIKILLTAGLICCPLMADAEEARIIISTKDGTVAEFYLVDDPVITYQDNLLVVRSNKREISVEAEQLQSFDFKPSETTGIDATMTDYNTEGSSLSGLPAGSKVQIFNTGGRLIRTSTVSADGKAIVDIDSLPEGVYIIKTSKSSFKVTNKK